MAYFWARGGGNLDLWRTDGTTAGTQTIAWGVGGLPFNAPLPEIASAGARVFFSAQDSQTGTELWTTDGTRAGSHIVLDLGRDEAGSDPHELVPQGNRIFFDACGIWQSAGTPESTTPLAGNEDFCNPNFYTRTRGLTLLGNLLFFGVGGPYNYQLWRTDGTASGTFQLTPNEISESGAVVFQGRLFFVAARPNQRAEIWSSDGTVAGTGKAFEFPEPLDVESNLSTDGSSLFFGARRANGSGPDLWVTDGTTAGSRRIKQFIDLYDYPRQVTRLNGSTFFVFSFGLLMKTDGTEAGTALVTLSTDGSVYGVQNLTLFHGALYFMANAPGGMALLRSDGTAEGTAVVRSFTSYGSGRQGSTDLTVFQDQIFFTADDGDHGPELWTSDGTAAGTVLVSDIRPGPGARDPAGLTAAGGRLFFAADEGVHGRELWQSDGTAAGTRLVQDISPAGGSSVPQGSSAAGDRLFFSADDGLARPRALGPPPRAARPAASPRTPPLPERRPLPGGGRLAGLPGRLRRRPRRRR